VQLCRHHHRLVHEGGFSCKKTPRGRLSSGTPRGSSLHGPATSRRCQVCSTSPSACAIVMKIYLSTPIPV
jgi:hypothetical protein